METDSSGGRDRAERWDQLYAVLSAEPRRMIVFSLMEVPEERRLPLPEAAESPNRSVDAETLRIELCHNHLPRLADAGYVRWEDDPFYVQRGPHFEEAATVIERVMDPVDQLPNTLIQDCQVLQELHEGS